MLRVTGSSETDRDRWFYTRLAKESISKGEQTAQRKQALAHRNRGREEDSLGGKRKQKSRADEEAKRESAVRRAGVWSQDGLASVGEAGSLEGGWGGEREVRWRRGRPTATAAVRRVDWDGLPALIIWENADGRGRHAL